MELTTTKKIWGNLVLDSKASSVPVPRALKSYISSLLKDKHPPKAGNEMS